MHDLNGFFWLSSYPKSGNTWFRIFLANLLFSENEPIDINQVDLIVNDHICTTKTWVDQMCGFNSGLFSDDEFDRLYPKLYEWYGENHVGVSYHKIHKAYTLVNHDRPLLPAKGCLGALYFVRNPLDIAVSLANHFSCSIDHAIDILGNKTYELRHFPVRQILLSWSMHVESWLHSAPLNCLFLRYEDLLKNPSETFTQATQFLRIRASSEKIEQAITFSQFKNLRQFEMEHEFLDKPPKLKHFFRKGIAGDWQEALNETQINRVIQDHAGMMKHFGYLNEFNQPVLDRT